MHNDNYLIPGCDPESPWGKIDHVENLDSEGHVKFVSTPSHGGVLLSAFAFAMLPPIIQNWAKNESFLKSSKWFEEDCDAPVILMALREVLKPDEQEKIDKYSKKMQDYFHRELPEIAKVLYSC